MFLTDYLLHVTKEDPSNAVLASHKLMLKTGMIKNVASGIYAWLPLGLRVLDKVSAIIRREMNAAGAMEILMPTIQPVELWKQSGRYSPTADLFQEMLKMKDRHDNDFIFTPTAEEMVTTLFKQHTQSYKNLPKNIYQIAWKFRDEIRPRFGVMRAREFLMKDSYSFHINQESALQTYYEMMKAYINIYKGMGLTAVPVAASSASMGGNYSHEFHILANTGESTIYYEESMLQYINSPEFEVKGLERFYAAEEEKHDPTKVEEGKLKIAKGIEVGHIFYLGNKYSKAMDFTVQDSDGTRKYPEMGCYGIGVSRLIGAIIEANHDEKGICWPEEISPFKVGIINLKPGDGNCDDLCHKLLAKLAEASVDGLCDDTEDSAGAKFARMDLLGLPWQIIVSPKNIASGVLEVKRRKTGEVKLLSLEEVISLVSA